MIGFPVAGFLLLLAALSANPCGAFGDACDDYGKTPPIFGLFALGTLVALVVAVRGLVMALSSRRRSGGSVGRVSLFAWAVIGLIAGAVGQRVAGTDRRGCLGTMAVGVLGAFVGGGLYRLLRGAEARVLDEFDMQSILVACLGSVALLLMLQAVAGRRQ